MKLDCVLLNTYSDVTCTTKYNYTKNALFETIYLPPLKAVVVTDVFVLTLKYRL